MPKFFATTAKGIEAVAAEELKLLGAVDVEAGYGGVHFEGDLELLYKACLGVRTATRILMPVRDFAAKNPEMLYDQVRRIKWENYLNPEKTFAVDCTVAGAKALKARDGRIDAPPAPGPRGGLSHSHYAALKIKDAIVDQLRQKQGARPNVDTESPDLRVVAFINNERCVLSFDASGASLHERGYRLRGAKAPLKETLAAAILMLSGWDPRTPFIDPMCGSGTLVLEAGLMALNIAPGLFRDRFGFFGWPDFDEALWTKVSDEAKAQVRRRVEAPIAGYDADRDAIASALDNAKRAGLSKSVHFEKRTIETLEPAGSAAGTLVVNPPYGERLGEVEELKALYGQLGDLFKQKMKGWTCFIFTGNRELAKSVGLRASRRFELFNGPIDCRLLKYEMY
ncbi:MAG: RNA methyltransferase [Deltaproteobacteria bacterium]|nr:RNA methyltransferase [Deltaproteobacteria bacterium]